MVSEHDQEIPKSQTADKPLAPRPDLQFCDDHISDKLAEIFIRDSFMSTVAHLLFDC